MIAVVSMLQEMKTVAKNDLAHQIPTAKYMTFTFSLMFVEEGELFLDLKFEVRNKI